MTNVAVVHRPAQSRFEAMSGEEVVGYLSYEIVGSTVDIQHTVVEPAHRKKGVGAALVEEALREIRAEKLRVRATCPFVAEFIQEHPEHQSLLEPSLAAEDLS
ncbi:GNAT family N-acetyltransferase [Ornithinimicrobium sp. LYQ121]|uniref:GNAT family N-acetyltransferase n=1 Tax=Ornithinimicrobium sp. LYQ121 TaxID=3378801 RepID=UPI003851DBE8